MRSTPTPLLAFCCILIQTLVQAQNPCISSAALVTPYDSDNGLAGIMFDVTAIQTITINCLEVNMAAGSADVILLRKDSTHVGFVDDPSAWTPVDSAAGVVTAGADLPTYIPFDVNVTVPAGTTQAFYFSNRLSSANTKYTNGVLLGNVFASDTYLQIREGTGIAWPFGFSLAPRKFNGAIYYSTSGIGIDETALMNTSIFPNPATDRLQLTGSPGRAISVTDALGQVVLNQHWTSSLDVSDLAPGHYQLRVTDLSGRPVAPVMFMKQ